jgi:PAS domain S-box-containing protein
MADHIRALDARDCPLGPVAGWPPALRALVAAMLTSNMPRFLVWGMQRVWLCNDACAGLLGAPAHARLGRPVDGVLVDRWPERIENGETYRIATRTDPACQLVCAPLFDESGAVAGFAGDCDTVPRAEREERYHALFAAADTGFCVIQLRFDDAGVAVDYRIVEGNPAFGRMTGLVGAEGRWVRDLVPDLEQHWFERYGHVARTGEAIRFEHRAEAFGKWYDVQALRIGDAADRHVAILFNDITDRRQTEARHATLLRLSDALRDLTDPDEIALAASEVLGYSLGVSRVGYGVVDKLAETIVIARDWNMPGVTSIAGTLHFRDYGTYIEDLKAGDVVAIDDVRDDPRTRVNASGLESIAARSFVNMPLVEQGQTVALLFANHAGPRRWSESDLLLMREVAERVRAATERARSEQATRESEEQFRVFAETVPNHIWSARPDGVIEWCNARLHLYSGHDRQSGAWPALWRDLVHPEEIEAVERRWARALRTGSVYENETRLRRRDGRYHWFLVRAEPVRTEAGIILRWVGTDTDIDDRRNQAAELAALNATLEEQVVARTARLMETEAALRQSQKMEAVGQLTGGLAHDFNNLLTGITGSLEMLGVRLKQARFADVERYSAAAQGAAKRAAALTHRLLAFSRRQTLDPKPTDVNRLVAGMEDMVRRTVGPSVAVEFVAAGGLWSTLVDPNQLENALLNLCINARDAMPEGGRLTVETANRWLDERTARDRDLEPGQYISLCVSDTGTGMTPEVIAKAFDPFFTTKPLGLGTGLGLSMIYGFARQSGGQVRIYSEPGEGATICIYLPRHLGPAEEADGDQASVPAPRADAGETVLVVDDEPTVRMLVTEVLEDLGYTAIEAADGPAGLRILQSDVRIDLLVSDVGLPGGMNGRQMADAARMARPDLTVLFITGYAENAVVGNGHLDVGMHVMTKPFALDALAARIKALIQSRPA